MAGHCLKDNEVDILKTWIDMAKKRLNNENFYESHIDKFISEIPKGSGRIDTAIEILDHCVHILTTSGEIDNIYPMVTISLGFSDEIETWEDNILSLDLPCIEPPSIYLLCRDFSLEPDLDTEEYKCPIELEFKHKEHYKCFFRCFRTSEGIENDWEFNKVIYVKFNPES